MGRAARSDRKRNPRFISPKGHLWHRAFSHRGVGPYGPEAKAEAPGAGHTPRPFTRKPCAIPTPPKILRLPASIKKAVLSPKKQPFLKP